MSLRVTAGKLKGRKLKSVPGDGTRPVTDMVKQAVFNILGPDVIGSNWWDVFGGTGAIGIEALSRGASFVFFTERSNIAVGVIKNNLRLCGLLDCSDVQKINAFYLISSTPNRKFDYIYIAPPQYKDLWSKSLFLFDDNINWLSSDSTIIVQIHPREYQRHDFSRITQNDERKYGSTMLLFYIRKE